MLISHEEVIWLHFERNPSPILRQLLLSFKCQFPLRMKYESTPKQILPPFWGSEWKPLHLWGRFRHFVMKLSEPKVLQVNFSVRGRAKPSRNLSCSQFSLRWGPSKILHPLSGGCGSRLSICQAQVNASKRQNKYWDGNAVYPSPFWSTILSFTHNLLFLHHFPFLHLLSFFYPFLLWAFFPISQP